MTEHGLIRRSAWVILLLLVVCAHHSAFTPEREAGSCHPSAPPKEGCTIGVVTSGASSDGRPMLWKVRDNSEFPDNAVAFDSSYPHRFIAVTNPGDSEAWMGVNEKGFAIINSTSLDLPGGVSGLNNGLLIRYALGNCASVEEFTVLLDSTNVTGRRTQGNFGVMDALGSAVMFEVGGNAYWTFDANDPTVAPDGYVLRTNFSSTGRGSLGIERYRRAVSQIGEFHRSGSLSYRRLIRYHARDFSDFGSNPLTVPYPRQWTQATPLGYLYSNVSVCRHKSVSAAVITGVGAGDDPRLSTMWTILGQPAAGIAVPYWPVGDPPQMASGSPIPRLNEIANKIRSLLFDFTSDPDYLDSYKLRDECGNGLWAETFPAEDSILAAADRLLEEWRRDVPPVRRMLMTENTLAIAAFTHLTHAYQHLMQRVPFDVSNNLPYKDETGKLLPAGAVIQLIWAGNDHRIDPPDATTGSQNRGLPTGDDRLIGIPHMVGENVLEEGMFHFQAIGWTGHAAGFPSAGELMYLRAFNSDNLETASRYGDAGLYRVSARSGIPYIASISRGQTSELLGALIEHDSLHARFALSTNFPNPFNSSTIIGYEVPYAPDFRGPVEITVFNNLGQAVRTLFSGMSYGGRQRVEWDGKDHAGRPQPSGIYYVRLKAATGTDTRRIVLLK